MRLWLDLEALMASPSKVEDASFVAKVTRWVVAMPQAPKTGDQHIDVTRSAHYEILSDIIRGTMMAPDAILSLHKTC